MKVYIITAITLLFSSTLCFGQQDTLKLESTIVLSINLNDNSGFINMFQSEEDKEENLIKQKKYLTHRIENNIPFKIYLNDTTENETIKSSILSIVQSPNTINKNEYQFKEFKERYSDNTTVLKSNEKLVFQIFLDTIPGEKSNSKNQKIFEVYIVTAEEGKPNDSFLMISAIKSIAGTKPDFELFDLNTKFNYSDMFFSMLSMDLSLSESDTIQNRMLVEGLLNINRFWGRKFTEKERKFFYGAGMKIFDSRVLLGLHLGSLEIDGPFYSSYFLLGYYYSIYNTPDIEDEIKRSQHNIYSEIAFTVQNENISLLSNLRIKIGFLLPLEYSDTEENNYQTRVVLEFPIGGIFRFK